MNTFERLQSINKELENHDAQLIAVSKTKSIEEILEVYNEGQRHFGENQVQELNEKHDKLPNDIIWHQIGSLQRNKVKYIAPYIGLIHSVDSLKLLQEINKQALKAKRVIDCLLQIQISDEDTKAGLDYADTIELLRSEEYQAMKNIRIIGLMGIASNTPNIKMVKEEFHDLKVLFSGIKESFFRKEDSFKELSMGMSSDYKIALEEGSTMVRIGSLIFGERDYSKN
ncbi:YggS family pyridoxal phosphate-dependent enzyme [Albibacterium sp.]|uniref:YggS family pyridoxal phosphate-dependent enzyme n=1 Tax=Albibacterium sp. TaxID=2952885 RepID=UPI002BF85FA7|nr:YggS family pyridoxal phosphate-dependent enzyme [Albibacterium sp.]HUH18126.1 YggS family pyridoxal phosphate-dependent enzyme [Albibacterium sp.]